MKQTIGNACGTIAIIHSIANSLDKVQLGMSVKCALNKYNVIYVRMYVSMCVRMSVHSCIRTYLHTCIHTYTHTNVHTHIQNTTNPMSSSGEGFMQDFLSKAQSVSPDERASLLESNEAIAEAHDAVAHEGQTEVSRTNTFP